ncbi:T9SS type A sorting domain-containing protein, partial [Flammeovirga pacifica]|uniref:T9SS type A sorting domain-containing protein n=1 Tax=Flammeovirga pacifica TaxID=915059 RepID=UPI00111496EE
FAAAVQFAGEDILASVMYNNQYPFFSFDRTETTAIEDENPTNLENELIGLKPVLLKSHPKFGQIKEIAFNNLNAVKTYSYSLININGKVINSGTLQKDEVIQLNNVLSGIHIIKLNDGANTFTYKLLR